MLKSCAACGASFKPEFVYQVAMEHAPDSHGAHDYDRVVDWLLGRPLDRSDAGNHLAA